MNPGLAYAMQNLDPEAGMWHAIIFAICAIVQVSTPLVLLIATVTDDRRRARERK